MQQIIAQELEIERLKRASISTGLGELSSENATSSKDPETTEQIRDKPSNGPTDAKQSGKDTVPLKEVVSPPERFLILDVIRKNFQVISAIFSYA